MKWFALLCLIVVLELPLNAWDKMPSAEQDRLITTAVTEFCSAYAKKYNIFNFKIRPIRYKNGKDQKFMLDIVPVETQT